MEQELETATVVHFRAINLYHLHRGCRPCPSPSCPAINSRGKISATILFRLDSRRLPITTLPVDHPSSRITTAGCPPVRRTPRNSKKKPVQLIMSSEEKVRKRADSWSTTTIHRQRCRDSSDPILPVRRPVPTEILNKNRHPRRRSPRVRSTDRSLPV